jgi:hypothetical protein
VTILPEATVAQLHAAVIARQDREIAHRKEQRIARKNAVREPGPSR